ncbi:cell envelope integrity protein CreD [Zophobihabitans entericus]|uniref:Cell envelope integrity protein CreD n=1 Tax=Zophobihabitans entericus TaxID=1635327 RepID=A0A6G9IA89_9GAMM|nr:cell envelope integrity protein CreD [Zophobihabitans entericus]QIQ21141.1 cell envelope integrity protein CreD [Zophobihabitans entericus]
MLHRLALMWKILALLGITIVLLIPTTMVMNMIWERSEYQREVVNSVASSSSGPQTVIGPIIVQPYTIERVELVNNKQRVVVEHKMLRYYLPEDLKITADANITTRNIGIYQSQIYQTDINFSGRFADLKTQDLDSPNVTLDRPYVIMMISDTRGIMQVPLMTFGDDKIKFEPGIKNANGSGGKGINAPLTFAQLEQAKLDFNFNLKLLGTGSLSVVPLGNSSEYQLTGNWPHPNFVGSSLPVTRTVTDDGFTASWQSSWYANNINSLFEKDRLVETGGGICSYSGYSCFTTFDTSFVETVDQYQLTERSVKYAILFIALTFIAFFLFETLKQLRIHPIQYALVGMALVLFYVVLLALSEHIDFLLAYILASLACSGLIGFYLSAILKGVMRGALFAIGLLVLYAILYAVMNSEGNALLLGALLLFSVLAGIMTLTRKIDWYQLSQGREQVSNNQIIEEK